MLIIFEPFLINIIINIINILLIIIINIKIKNSNKNKYNPIEILKQ